MSKYKINELIFCGVRGDHELVRAAANDATLIIARGNSAADWLCEIGVEGAITWELPEGKQHLQIDSLHSQVTALIPDEADMIVLYVTPLQPFAIDILGGQLAAQAENITSIAGADLLITLSTLDAEIANGAVQSLDGLKLKDDRFPTFSTGMPAVLSLAGMNIRNSNILTSLCQVYPDTHGIYTHENNKWLPILLREMDKAGEKIDALYIPALAEDSALENFLQVIARLRAPDGCPWDRKQTHTSLRPYLLEEAYEALEALDNGDITGLREELGDILLQIALHTQIAVENGEFTIADVLQGISRKIVSRHPHVFAEVIVRDDRDVVQNWEKLKEIERVENGDEHHKGLLDGIPSILPSLSQAQSIQERVARVGFDWPEIAPVLDKVMEEMQEVNEAADENARAHELGDLLFAVVNLVRWYHVDAESALRRANMKFRKRFAYIEAQARNSGRELQKMTLAEMDSLWEEAKEYDD